MPGRAAKNSELARLYGLAKKGTLLNRIDLLKKLIQIPKYQSEKMLSRKDFQEIFGNYGDTIKFEIYAIFLNEWLKEDLERIARKGQEIGYNTSRFLVSKFNLNPIAVVSTMNKMRKSMRIKTKNKITHFNFKETEKNLRALVEHDHIQCLRLALMQVAERNKYVLTRPKDQFESIFMSYLKSKNLSRSSAEDLLRDRTIFLETLKNPRS